MKITILTIFPEMIRNMLSMSIIKNAQADKIVSFDVVDIRDFSEEKYNKVDDAPFGGGPGMLFMPTVISKVLKSVDSKNAKKLYPSPRGKILNYDTLKELKKEKEIIILCGHYEGVDIRAIEKGNFEEISIGDYILSGGEPAAFVIIDSLIRLLEGSLGNEESHREESIYSGLIEYPQWTRPRNFEGMKVPDVLISGDHKKIHLFQYELALKNTQKIRKDLFSKYVTDVYYRQSLELTKEEKAILKKIIENE